MKRLAVIGLAIALVSCSKPPSASPHFIMIRSGDGIPEHVYTFKMVAFPTHWSQIAIWCAVTITLPQ